MNRRGAALEASFQENLVDVLGEFLAGVEHGRWLPPHPPPSQSESHGVVAGHDEGGEGDRHARGRASEQGRGHGRKDAPNIGKDYVRPLVYGVTNAAAHRRGVVAARDAGEEVKLKML